jgi:hypothetical protein
MGDNYTYRFGTTCGQVARNAANAYNPGWSGALPDVLTNNNFWRDSAADDAGMACLTNQSNAVFGQLGSLVDTLGGQDSVHVSGDE